MKVKTHRFNNHKYDIVLTGPIDGICDTSRTPPFSLVITCDLNTKAGLIALIHESMHAGNWDKHEETIQRSSAEIGNLLWRLGYRRRKK